MAHHFHLFVLNGQPDLQILPDPVYLLLSVLLYFRQFLLTQQDYCRMHLPEVPAHILKDRSQYPLPDVLPPSFPPSATACFFL